GRRLDSVTGLYNFREREYSPTMGRWMQSDPLGFAAGDSNLYRTEGNNVTNGIDPSGLDASSRGTGPTGQTWDPLDSPSPSDMIARENEALKLQRRLDWMIEAQKRSQSSLGKPGKDRSLEEWNLEIEIRLLRNPKYVR